MDQYFPEGDIAGSAQILDEFASHSAKLLEIEVLNNVALKLESQKNKDEQIDSLACESLDENQRLFSEATAKDENVTNLNDQTQVILSDASDKVSAESRPDEPSELDNQNDQIIISRWNIDSNTIISGSINGLPVIEGYCEHSKPTDAQSDYDEIFKTEVLIHDVDKSCQLHEVESCTKIYRDKQHTLEPDLGPSDFDLQTPKLTDTLYSNSHKALNDSDRDEITSGAYLGTLSSPLWLISGMIDGLHIIQACSEFESRKTSWSEKSACYSTQGLSDVTDTLQVVGEVSDGYEIKSLLGGSSYGAPLNNGISTYSVELRITGQEKSLTSPLGQGDNEQSIESETIFSLPKDSNQAQDIMRSDPSKQNKYASQETFETSLYGNENLLISGIAGGIPIILSFVKSCPDRTKLQYDEENASVFATPVSQCPEVDNLDQKRIPEESLDQLAGKSVHCTGEISTDSQEKLNDLVAEVQQYSSLSCQNMEASNHFASKEEGQMFRTSFRDAGYPETFHTILSRSPYQSSTCHESFLSENIIPNDDEVHDDTYSPSNFFGSILKTSSLRGPCEASPSTIQHSLNADKQHDSNIHSSLKNIQDLGNRLQSILDSLNLNVDQQSASTTIKIGQNTGCTSLTDKTLSTMYEGLTCPFNATFPPGYDTTKSSITTGRLTKSHDTSNRVSEDHRICQTETRQHVLDDHIKLLQNLAQESTEHSLCYRPQFLSGQTCALSYDDPPTEQSRESKEEGFLDDRGNVVVSKKVTRIVTTTKTVFDSESSEPKTESVQSVEESKVGGSPTLITDFSKQP